MGTHESKIQNNSEEFRKEYFKIVQKDINEGIKLVNSTINKLDETKFENNENWMAFLKYKLKEYLGKNKTENRNNYIHDILKHLDNYQECNETKYQYNLKIYLAKSIDDLQSTNTSNSNEYIYDNFFTEEESKTNQTISRKDTNFKDKMLWRGFNFILKDLENFYHPINKLTRQIISVLSEFYENEFEMEKTNKELIDRCVHNKNNNIYMTYPLKTNFSNGTDFPHIHESPIKNEIENKNYINLNHEITLLTLSSVDPSSKQDKIKEMYNKFLNEFFFFSDLITNALILFYSLKNSAPNKLVEIFREKIKDFVLRKDLYRFIIKIKSKLIENKKEKFSKYLLNFYEIRPNGLNISPYFSLDFNFKKSFEKFIYDKNEDECDFNISDNNIIPFRDSILILRKINQCDSILEKIDLIFNLRESILKEVDTFWNNIPIKNKYKILDADNLLSIVIYIIIKSQMSDIIVELSVIEDILDNRIKLSRKGYFFNLMKSSIDYMISHLNYEQINQNLEEYESNVLEELKLLNSNPKIILKELKEN